MDWPPCASRSEAEATHGGTAERSPYAFQPATNFRPHAARFAASSSGASATQPDPLLGCACLGGVAGAMGAGCSLTRA
jgi:hypothetical protein